MQDGGEGAYVAEMVSCLMCTFAVSLWLPDIWGLIVCVVFIVVVGIYCLGQLLKRLGMEHRIYRKLSLIPGLRKLIRSDLS